MERFIKFKYLEFWATNDPNTYAARWYVQNLAPFRLGYIQYNNWNKCWYFKPDLEDHVKLLEHYLKEITRFMAALKDMVETSTSKIEQDDECYELYD